MGIGITREDGFTIGTLARHAKVGVETIRYYQSFGLLQEPPKPGTGYRQYPIEALERLQFIRRAQELGFSLKEISRLLSLSDNVLESRAMVAEKLLAVHSRITQLISVRTVLEELIDRFDAHPDASGSPVVSALSVTTNPP